MKYTVQKLDGRFTYRDWFEYLIAFPGRMANKQGPLNFTRTQKWFTETYGWSAEIRQYADIYNFHITTSKLNNYRTGPLAPKLSGQLLELPPECNPYWSWTNGHQYPDLRIYVKGDAELAFFRLKFPVDQ